jgi:hypothetical protein
VLELHQRVSVTTWFETRGVAALLTMRVQDLILRSALFARVSKDGATELEYAIAKPMNSRRNT